MRKIYNFIFIIFLCQQSYSQQSMTLYNMTAVSQRNQLNPALPFNGNGFVGLPLLSSVYFNLSNSAFSYKDFVRTSDDDSLYLDPQNIIGKMKDQNNFINVSGNIDVLNFGFKINKSYFGLAVTEKINTQFDYPKEMMEFLWKGNAATLGKTSVLKFGFSFMHYREYAFTYSTLVNDKFSIGLKIKYLYGMENAYSNGSKITLRTDPSSFAIAAKTNINITTAGIESNNFNDFSFGEYAFGRKNKGYAVDLGVAYKLNEKFSISASILDIGKINWNSNVVNYTSNTANEEFTYNGIDLNQFFSDTAETANIWQQLADTLSSSFQIKTNNNSYDTKLPVQYYFGESYLINENNSVSFLIHGEKFENKFYPDFTFSYNKEVNKWLNIAASYSVINQGYKNLGLGVSLTLGHQQIYFISDNVYGVIFPTKTKNVNFRTGINYIFSKNVKHAKRNKAIKIE